MIYLVYILSGPETFLGEWHINLINKLLAKITMMNAICVFHSCDWVND